MTTTAWHKQPCNAGCDGEDHNLASGEYQDLVEGILRTHTSTVVRSQSGDGYTHDAVCKACLAPLPWGEDHRARVLIAHQAAVICEALGR